MIPNFRAWDKTTNQMRGCYGFNELEREVYVCSVADDEFNGRLRTVHALRRNFDEVVLMQSTGLEDKNGVEICEGDIVRVFIEEEYQTIDMLDIVVFENGSFTTQSFAYDFYNNGGDLLTVKGNIYEHPELLEELEE